MVVPLLLPADVAEHVRMDVQADVRHVVNVLGRHEPDDLTDFPLGKMPRHARERVGINLFMSNPCGCSMAGRNVFISGSA